MKLASLDLTEEETVVLKIEFEDTTEALEYCIDHEIKMEPKFFEKVSGE